MNTVNVGIIGTKFMGKAHSNAWSSVDKFFDVGLKPVLKVACGRDPQGTQDFADNWGWQETSTDWAEVVKRDDIDIIDICVPTYLHKEIFLAAAENGKNIFCEKPAALNYAQAKEMYEAAEKAGILHYLNHNYRRTPAVSFAKKMIEEGLIGKIYHWRGAYLRQGHIDPLHHHGRRYHENNQQNQHHIHKRRHVDIRHQTVVVASNAHEPLLSMRRMSRSMIFRKSAEKLCSSDSNILIFCIK